MIDCDSDRRVLVSVSPPLLAELLARELRRSELEVVVVEDPIGFGDQREYALVVTNGLPPARALVRTVVRLPDRTRGGDLGSLVTTGGVERVPIPELAAVVRLVHELCGRTDLDPG